LLCPPNLGTELPNSNETAFLGRLPGRWLRIG
jgi:hypothetical protein